MQSDFLKAASAYNQMSGIMPRASTALMPQESEESSSSGGSSDFASLVSNALDKAYRTISNSEVLSRKAVMKEANLSDVVTAISEAETTLQTVLSIRDKAISAYQDIIRMPI